MLVLQTIPVVIVVATTDNGLSLNQKWRGIFLRGRRRTASQPIGNYAFRPCNGLCRQPHRPWKLTFGHQVIDSGTGQAGEFFDCTAAQVFVSNRLGCSLGHETSFCFAWRLPGEVGMCQKRSRKEGVASKILTRLPLALERRGQPPTAQVRVGYWNNRLKGLKSQGPDNPVDNEKINLTKTKSLMFVVRLNHPQHQATAPRFQADS